MPSYFVRQPNGLLAVFSTIVDHFTHLNLSEADAITWCGEQRLTEQESQDKVRRGVEDEPIGRRCCDIVGHQRWHDCLNTILHCHGTTGLAKFLADYQFVYRDVTTSEATVS
jgi:hypothetical protein